MPLSAADQYHVKVYRADRCCRPRDLIVYSFPKGASLIAPRL